MDNQDQPHGSEWRERMLNICKDLPLYDAVYSTNYFNIRIASMPQPHAPEINLSDIFPHASPMQIIEAISAAKSLDLAINEFSNYIYSNMNPKDVADKLKRLHPGFTERSYSTILGRAQMMAVR